MSLFCLKLQKLPGLFFYYYYYYKATRPFSKMKRIYYFNIFAQHLPYKPFD